MLDFIFGILMLVVFGKIAIFALKASWKITKFFVCVILAPVVLILIAIEGFVILAIFLTLGIGILSLIFD